MRTNYNSFNTIVMGAVRRCLPILVLTVSIVVTSCKTEQRKSVDLPNTEKTPPNDTSIKSINTDGTATDSPQERQVNVGTINTNGTTGGNSNLFNEEKADIDVTGFRIPDMYNKLEMSPTQIEAYEKGMSAYQERLGGGSQMSQASTLKEEIENQLKRILSHEQFNRYKELK